MRTSAFFLLLFLNSTAFGQVLTDSTSNFYVAVSLGEAQLNIKNGNGLYGRSEVIPRINAEFGYASAAPGAKKSFYITSLGFSYQELSLRKIKNTDRYNDRLSVLDIHLQGLLGIGGPMLMFYAGPIIRIPVYSQFDVYTLTGDGTYKWVSLNQALKAVKPYLAAKVGIKFLFTVAQVGISFTHTYLNFLNGKGSTYSIDALQYYTVEGTLYLPLKFRR